MADRNKIIPIQFTEDMRDCFECGSKDSIRFVNRTNDLSTKLFKADKGTYQIRCMACGHPYTIKWAKDSYILEDQNVVYSDFIKYFTDHPKRDIDEIMEREYELPDPSGKSQNE